MVPNKLYLCVHALGWIDIQPESGSRRRLSSARWRARPLNAWERSRAWAEDLDRQLQERGFSYDPDADAPHIVEVDSPPRSVREVDVFGVEVARARGLWAEPQGGRMQLSVGSGVFTPYHATLVMAEEHISYGGVSRRPAGRRGLRATALVHR